MVLRLSHVRQHTIVLAVVHRSRFVTRLNYSAWLGNVSADEQFAKSRYVHGATSWTSFRIPVCSITTPFSPRPKSLQEFVIKRFYCIRDRANNIPGNYFAQFKRIIVMLDGMESTTPIYTWVKKIYPLTCSGI